MFEASFLLFLYNFLNLFQHLKACLEHKECKIRLIVFETLQSWYLHRSLQKKQELMLFFFSDCSLSSICFAYFFSNILKMASSFPLYGSKAASTESKRSGA